MNLHLQFALYLIAVSMLSGSFGFIVAVFFLSLKHHRIERESWNQARRHYTQQTERGL